MSVAIWFTIGIISLIIGLIMMLFSEIKAVLICRDQDFRVSLHNNEYMAPASAGIAELEHRESMQVCLRQSVYM